jgi:thiamine biosynthesis lipoprotein ApbE
LLRIHDARVTIGPVTRVLGTRHGKPWHVALAHAHPGASLGDGEAACLVDPGDVSLKPDLLDPRTGTAPSQPVTVLVIAANGSDASVGCSVLAIAGPQGWKRAASDLGLDTVSLRTADGRLLESAAMAARRKQERASGKNG